MKNTQIHAARVAPLFVDDELSAMLLQLREVRRHFLDYLKKHNNPHKETYCSAAFDVESDLSNAMIGLTQMISTSMADHLLETPEEDESVCS